MTFPIKLFTAWRLGPVSVLRALAYRLGLRAGVNPVKKLQGKVQKGPFYRGKVEISPGLPPREGWWQHAECFGIAGEPLSDAPPAWHHSSLSGIGSEPRLPWWRIPDFNSDLGDIKGVWEASRFDWVLVCAQHAAVGEEEGIRRLNVWLESWAAANPPYLGANWKCGQEASIRVLHLAMGALLLDQIQDPEPALLALVKLHLQRIAPTIQYAVAQDNNHGTSEAAALFVGGSWLQSLGEREGRRWARMGRRWLENRAARLIEPDGSFSQYSVNYHRVMLDTYSMAEIWRQRLLLAPFSPRLADRLRAATGWLANMIASPEGDTPNLGANDGARLLPLTDTDYRDYRPSVQLASVLFCEARAYAQAGSWDWPLAWLGIDGNKPVEEHQGSRQYDDGGYAILRHGESMALLRYPRFRFRPGQSDLLHVDFWRGGHNWLRDGGSYSYNTEPPWQDYFPGVASHNTVQFDGHDQMPRLSRFLFGAWPSTRDLKPLREEQGTLIIEAGYKDWRGARHHRALRLSDHSLEVVDRVSGFARSAVLRWRLPPGDWLWQEGLLCQGGVSLRVQSTAPVVRMEVVEGWESRYYSQKTQLPVLEVEIDRAGTLTTELTFSS